MDNESAKRLLAGIILAATLAAANAAKQLLEDPATTAPTPPAAAGSPEQDYKNPPLPAEFRRAIDNDVTFTHQPSKRYPHDTTDALKLFKSFILLGLGAGMGLTAVWQGLTS